MLWFNSAPESDGFVEDLLKQSRKNFQSFLLITIEYLKEQDLDLEEFFNYMGQQSIVSWQDTESPSMEEIAGAFNFNLLSLGMQCIEQKREENTVTITYTPLVTDEDLDQFHITMQDLDKFWKSLETIANHFNTQCSFDYVEDNFVLTLTKD